MNSYGYVGGNPLTRLDPFGLDIVDINNIIRDMPELFPNLDTDYSVEFAQLKSGATGQYIRLTETMRFNPEQKCKSLTYDEYFDLYLTIYHETLHHNQPFWEVPVDFYYEEYWRRKGEDRLGPYHNNIWDIVTDLRKQEWFQKWTKVRYEGSRNRSPDSLPEQCGCK